MPTFDVEHEGKKFRVEAADPAAAAAALSLHTGKQASPSMFEGVSRAVARGVPLVGGLLNKANAATNAALAPIVDPLLPDTFEKLPGKTYGERYDQALAIQEGKDKSFNAEHPIADAVAEVGGAVASTGVAGATKTGATLLGLTGKTMPQLMARGAASGMALSGADAAIRGENPLTAAAVGGGVGAVAPPIGRVINSKIVQPIANTVRGILKPAEEAERRVASALNRDMTAGDRGLTPREFVDARNSGTPVNLMDMGGETTRALARSAANTSPEGRSGLSRVIDERFESQAPRLAEWLGHTFHFPNASAQQDALDTVARTINRPNYAKAYSDGANLKFDETFEQISQAPVVQDAIRKAMVNAKNEAARSGFTPPKNQIGRAHV